MSSRLSAPQKWHTGALYDAIWEFDLPPIVLTEGKRAGRVDTHGQPVLEVSETAQRLVLMAMAKHTNPTRDRGRYRCCPTVDRLATLTGVLARQVQLVLKTQKDLGYITEERQGMRAGRNRPARPSWWELHPDRWPRRTLDGREAGFATNGDLVMVAKPATDGHEAGHVTNGWSRSRPLENVDGREAGFTLTRNSGTRNTGAKPIDEPARAAARAELAEDASTPDSHAEMLVDPEPRQVALPLTGAVGLPAGAGVALPSNSPETLLEAGRQLWRAVRDPLLRGDVNVPPVLVARLRNTGTASFDAVTGVLVLEGALLPEDLEEPLILQALAAAAGGRSVTLQLVGPASPSPRAPGESRGPSGVDSSPDVRSPEERWAADREFLVSKGVPEERLRRLEYDMLGASHCEVCQMLALEQSDAAAATA